MTVIPDGGHAEVEWGVQRVSVNGTRTDNLSLHYASGEDQRMARQIAVAGIRDPRLGDYGPQKVTLVAREVTYGPWVTVTIDQQQEQ